MKKTLLSLLSLTLMGCFAYAQNSDLEEEDDFSDGASFRSASEDPLSAYESLQLCLPLYHFPEDGAFAPYLVEEGTEEMYLNGVYYERSIREQEPLDGVGPLNPLITELDIQGVHGAGQDAPIIFFAPIEVFDGQLDAVEGARMRVVGPIYFGEDAYAVVPEGAAFDEQVQVNGFRGTLIRYDPNEETAGEALNQWLLVNEGWYLHEGEEPGRVQVVQDGGEFLMNFNAAELNDFWATEYGLEQETYEDSVFAEIEMLVQRVFWRFYRAAHPETFVDVLWVELNEILDELIEEEGWDALTRVYLNNYQMLLGVWYRVFEERGLLRPIYIPPPIYAAAIEDVFAVIDGLIEGMLDPLLGPTGRVTVLGNPVPLGEWTPVEPELAVEALRSLGMRDRDDYIEALLAGIAPRVAVDTLLGATECWF